MKLSLLEEKGRFWALITLLRPHHYTKNVLVFAPVFFSGEFGNLELDGKALAAFVSMCLAASAVYGFNDIFDAEMDRRHPSKRFRPLALGMVTRKEAIWATASCALFGVFLSALVNTATVDFVLTYLSIGFLYTVFLKKVAIIDVLTVSVCLVIRLFVGSAATMIHLSKWIIVLTFFLALFLTLAKRRDELRIYRKTEMNMRHALDGYNKAFLDISLSVTAAVVLAVYLMYVTSDEIVARIPIGCLLASTFFVVLGLLRYLQLIFTEKDTGSPVRVFFQDRKIQLALAGWILTFVCGLYL